MQKAISLAQGIGFLVILIPEQIKEMGWKMGGKVREQYGKESMEMAC